jgi:hypothetical protein
MLHLIIEACISRKLIDTSAYLWPGYVVSSVPLKDTTLPQESPWLNFIKGAPLSGPLIDALVATPASRCVNLYSQLVLTGHFSPCIRRKMPVIKSKKGSNGALTHKHTL